MKRASALIILLLLAVSIPSPVSARGSISSGSRSSFSSSRSYSSPSRSTSSSSKTSSSSSRSTSSKSSTSTSKSASSPKVGTSTKKPGSTIKTSSGKTVKSSTKKPSNSRYTNSKGIVGDNGYKPGFRGGYSAPAGSVVYYPQHSFVDYLPWIYLFSQSSPRNDNATVVQPDGKEVKAQPVKEGTDGIEILNWIVVVLLALAVIVGIVYLVNWLSNRPRKPKTPIMRHLNV